MKEILKNLVETMTLPEDSYLEQDAEILEIFIEEIEEIFEELNPLFTNGTRHTKAFAVMVTVNIAQILDVLMIVVNVGRE